MSLKTSCLRHIPFAMTGVAALMAAACDTHYEPDPPIDTSAALVYTAGYPQGPVVLAGDRVTFMCQRPSDKDTACSMYTLSGVVHYGTPYLVDDALGDPNFWPKWTAQGGSIIGDSEGVNTIVWQAPDGEGSATISFSDDDLPTPVDANSGDTGDRDDEGVDPAASTGVQVVVPEVVTVAWPSYTMYDRDPAKSEWDDSNVPLHYPQYDNISGTLFTAPVCMAFGLAPSTVYITAQCRIVAPLTQSTSFSLKAEGPINFGEGGSSFSPGLAPGALISSASTHGNVEAIPSQVYCDTVNQAWKYRVPAGSNTWIDINNTSVPLYLTYGEPGGSCVTERRVWEVCTLASGQSEPNNIAKAIFDGLPSEMYNLEAENDGPVPIWLLYDGEESACPGLAWFVGVHFSMIGMPDWQRLFCYALPDFWFLPPSHPWNQYATASYRDSYFGWPALPTRAPAATVGHPNSTGHGDKGWPECLYMVDGDGNRNTYEATCYFGGRHFALLGETKGIFADHTEVVKYCFSTDWYYVDPNSPNLPDPNDYFGDDWALYCKACVSPDGRPYPPFP